MDLGLAGRCYVLSGGTRGLGRATAEALVAEGALVVVASRTPDAVDRTARELGAERAEGVVADLADPAAADRLVAAALGRFGRLDGALLNVGGPPAGGAFDGDDDAWRASFESIVLGPRRLAAACVAALAPGGGALLFTLSSSVRSPIPGLAVSNALRPGLAMLAKTMADELGPRGVRVNGLLPGRVATDRIAELDALSGDLAAARARNEAAIPLRRYGDPAEYGRVAAFLLSPAASYVSGAVLPVDGGALRTI